MATMATINTNVPSLVAQRHLWRAQRDLQTSLERLASGLRINRGADDPAGLIASENLRSEIAGVSQAIDNSQRAINVIATAEGAMSEVAALLVDIQDLIVEAANEGAMSEDEIRANQLQIDSAVDSITRIANSTTFAGQHLLNGALDYVTSGVATSALANLQIHSVNFGTRDWIGVEVNVTQSAQPAQLFFRSSAISTSVTLEIMGNYGVATLSLLSGTTADKIVDAFNTISDATGVHAALVSAGDPSQGVRFYSDGYGSKAVVSIEPMGGSTFAVENAESESVTREYGQDAAATINGAQSIGDGLNLVLNTSLLDLSLTLSEDFGIGTTSFAITGGGAMFQLGSSVNTSQRVGIGIQSIAASRLGNRIVGFLSEIVTGGENSLVAGKYREASKIVDEAIRQVAVLRGRLGAFEKNTLHTNINQLGITFENLMAAESSIRDTDFAEETANMTRAQILVNAGTSVLAMANAVPQTVLALLGG